MAGINSGSINLSYNSGTLTTSSSDTDIGGLVGNNSGAISNDYSVATLTGGGTNVGGLIGNNNGSASILDSYSSGSVSGTSNVGGLIGTNSASLAAIIGSFWDMTSSNQLNSAGGTGLDTSDMQNLSTFTNAGWNITATPGTTAAPNNTWFIFPGSTRPILLNEWSSTISTPHQLQLVGAALNVIYSVVSNINMSSDLTAGDIWGGLGFTPIGGDPSTGATPFSGVFNGSNLTISNLTINLPNNSYVGLFGETVGGSLIGIILTNASITGGSDTGFIIGSNGNNTTGSVLENSKVSSGTLTESIDNAQNIGGLVGINAASTSNIILSNNAGSIIINGNNVENIGGLAGMNAGVMTGLANSASILNSGAITLNGSNIQYVGGIVGYNTQNLLFAQSPGTITATQPVSYLGGIIGYNSSTGSINLKNGVTSGLITLVSTAANPATYIGGVVGDNVGTVASPAYSGTLTITGSNADYVGGTIGANSGTLTGSPNDGQTFAHTFTGILIAPTASLDVGGLIGLMISGTTTNLYDSGTITVGSGSTNIGGVVGAVSGGTVTRGSETGTLTADSSQNVGGIVGNNSGTVSSFFDNETVNVTSNSSTSTAIGGIAGLNTGTLSNNYNIASINASGAMNVGGIVGDNAGTVNTSYSTGAVTGGTNTGGFVGLNEATGVINESFWDTDTSTLANGYGANAGSLATLIGGCFSGVCTNGGTADLSAYTTFANAGWDITDVAGGATPPTNAWFIYDGGTRPFLTTEWDQVYIVTAHQIQAMGLTLSSTMRVVGDIDLSATQNNPADIWGGQGFVPIGTGGSSFAGTIFTEGGIQLSNLYIDLPNASNVGFVSVNTGTVEGLSLINANVIGGNNTGGLVGSNGLGSTGGSIEDDFINGNITGSGDNIQNVGSLAGTNANSNSTINNSLSSGNGQYRWQQCYQYRRPGRIQSRQSHF